MRTLKVKMAIDCFMTLLLLLLMAYQVTGEALHEWIGVGMFILFLLHNILNIRWYGALAKGKYPALRVLRTVINFAVLADILLQAYSGIVLSRHVFAALPSHGGMATARVIHLAGSYWGFVLMSLHLGLHWGVIMGRFCRQSSRKTPAALKWVLRGMAIGIAVYGAVCFYRADIASYLFLKVEFAFLDYEKSAALILTEYMGMIGLWIFLAYYASKALGNVFKKVKRKENRHEKN